MDGTEDLYYALDQLEPVALEGIFYRHTAPARDPLSGEGARLLGGRWNPPGLSCIYLARPRDTCIGEFERMAQGQGRGPASFLPRELHTIAVTQLPVLDLTSNDNLSAIGMNLGDISGLHGPCQQIGEIAHTLGLRGLLAPSATGAGEVLAVYPRRAHHGELRVLDTEVLAE